MFLLWFIGVTLAGKSESRLDLVKAFGFLERHCFTQVISLNQYILIWWHDLSRDQTSRSSLHSLGCCGLVFFRKRHLNWFCLTQRVNLSLGNIWKIHFSSSVRDTGDLEKKRNPTSFSRSRHNLSRIPPAPPLNTQKSFSEVRRQCFEGHSLFLAVCDEGTTLRVRTIETR